MFFFKQTGFHNAPLKRCATTGHFTMKPQTGDLTSGRAFDSGCRCYESSEGVLNDLLRRRTECHCGAPRLAPQLEFVKALMAIGKKLQQLPTKEQRSEYLLIFRGQQQCRFGQLLDLLFCYLVIFGS